jgi:hypothetical protein
MSLFNSNEEFKIKQLSSQLADKAQKGELVINVKDYGAKGDGVANDATSIQNAINSCPVGGTVFIPPSTNPYKITSTLTINKAIKFVGANIGVEIKHYGTGAAIKISAWDWSLENIHFSGDGVEQQQADGTYLYGVGATSEYGIELDGTVGGVNRFNLRNVKATKHSKHGVYCHGGVWIGLFDGCNMFYNGLDGVNAVYEGSIQNGNNFTFLGGSYSGNGRNGIQWGAANGSFLNIDAETNNKAGICLTKCTGANIIGGYFENNHEEQILLDATLGIITWSIKGAYLNSSFAVAGGGSSLIKAIGTNSIIQSIEDVNWSKSGALVTYYADFNSLPTTGSYLRFSENNGSITTLFQNLGKMKILTSPRDIMAIGKYLGKGNITFSAFNQSDNFYAVGTKTVEFMIPITEQDIVTNILFYLTTNATDQITVTGKLSHCYFSGGVTDINLSATITGSGTVTLTPSTPFRIDSLRGAILSLTFSNPATGSSLVMGNPIIQVA